MTYQSLRQLHRLARKRQDITKQWTGKAQRGPWKAISNLPNRVIDRRRIMEDAHEGYREEEKEEGKDKSWEDTKTPDLVNCFSRKCSTKENPATWAGPGIQKHRGGVKGVYSVKFII